MQSRGGEFTKCLPFVTEKDEKIGGIEVRAGWNTLVRAFWTKKPLEKFQKIAKKVLTNPKQFDIIGMAASAGYKKEIVGLDFLGSKDARPLINGKNTYARVFIKRK